MDTRKVTLIATVALIALVAVGIGYAYTASTENSENDVGSEYLVITPTTGDAQVYSGSFDENIAYDTVKVAGFVNYSLSGAATIDGRKAVEAGSIYLVIDQQKTKAATYSLNTICSAGTIDTTNFLFKFAIKQGTADTEDAAKTAADGAEITYSNYDASTGVTISPISVTKKFTVVKLTMYVCLSTSDEKQVTDAVYAESGLPIAALSNAKFSFVASAAPYSLAINLGSGMTLVSGSLNQLKTGAITQIVIAASDGHSFGAGYKFSNGTTSLNGLTLAVDTENDRITISGTMTGETVETLPNCPAD